MTADALFALMGRGIDDEDAEIEARAACLVLAEAIDIARLWKRATFK